MPKQQKTQINKSNDLTLAQQLEAIELEDKKGQEEQTPTVKGVYNEARIRLVKDINALRGNFRLWNKGELTIEQALRIMEEMESERKFLKGFYFKRPEEDRRAKAEAEGKKVIDYVSVKNAFLKLVENFSAEVTLMASQLGKLPSNN